MAQVSSYMPSMSSNFLAATRSSHKVTAKADVYYGGSLVATVPLVSGTINVDRTADNCRSGTAIVGDPAFAPVFVNSPLAPYGAELRIYYGIVYDSGFTEWVPLGVFTLDETDCEDSTGNLPQITFYDRSKSIQRCNFRGPASWAGMDARAAIKMLVTLPLPAAKVIFDPSLGSITQNIPGGTVWTNEDGDRWKAIQTMCAWLGAEGRFGWDGNFYVVPVPSLIGVSSPVPVWTFDAGDNGVMVQALRGTLRAGCYNFVYVEGVSNTNAASPVGHAWDSDPRSPTFWGVTRNSGDTTNVQPFGPTVLFVQNDQLLTTATCNAYATTQLSNVLGLARSLDFTAVPMPGLDAGDIVKVVYKSGLYEYHLMDSFTVPLGTTDSFIGTTRTQTYQLSAGT